MGPGTFEEIECLKEIKKFLGGYNKFLPKFNLFLRYSENGIHYRESTFTLSLLKIKGNKRKCAL